MPHSHHSDTIPCQCQRRVEQTWMWYAMVASSFDDITNIWVELWLPFREPAPGRLSSFFHQSCTCQSSPWPMKRSHSLGENGERKHRNLTAEVIIALLSWAGCSKQVYVEYCWIMFTLCEPNVGQLIIPLPQVSFESPRHFSKKLLSGGICSPCSSPSKAFRTKASSSVEDLEPL